MRGPSVGRKRPKRACDTPHQTVKRIAAMHNTSDVPEKIKPNFLIH